MNKFLIWFGMNILATSLMATTNTINIDSERITIPSKSTRMYSLQEKTNLNENWEEISRTRGNESNLVFQIDYSKQQGFYRYVSTYEPIEPTSKSTSWSYSQGSGIHECSYSFDVINYASSNLEATVDWEDVISVGVTYRNTPFNQTLTPGTNTVTYATTLNTQYMTAFTAGSVIIRMQ